MKGTLKKEGKYELFKTNHDNLVLTLDEKDWYAVVEGQQGDILVGSGSDHKKQKTVRKGKYYYADFNNDPDFHDIPHLFMKDGDGFYEFLLPNGLPENKGDQVRLIQPKDKLSEQKVMSHIKGKGKSDKEDLSSKTKDELYEMAKAQDIEGRSKMNKDELIEHLS